MKYFKVIRVSDESGVSGIGHVLDGVVFNDGTTVIKWLTEMSSIAIYKNFEEFKAIHIDSHPTNESRIEMIEFPQRQDTRRPCPVKDPAQDKDACRQFGSDACQWNTEALVDCHYVRGDPVDVMDWLHVVDVVKWEVVEKMIQDPMIPPAIVAYWTKALKLRREGMLTDNEIIKRLKEAD